MPLSFVVYTHTECLSDCPTPVSSSLVAFPLRARHFGPLHTMDDNGEPLELRPFKRARSLEVISTARASRAQGMPHESGLTRDEPCLFDLPVELVDAMMATLTSTELTALSTTCRYFWMRAPCGLRRVHKYAKEKLTRLAGEVQASRWR